MNNVLKINRAIHKVFVTKLVILLLVTNSFVEGYEPARVISVSILMHSAGDSVELLTEEAIALKVMGFAEQAKKMGDLSEADKLLDQQIVAVYKLKLPNDSLETFIDIRRLSILWTNYNWDIPRDRSLFLSKNEIVAFHRSNENNKLFLLRMDRFKDMCLESYEGEAFQKALKLISQK